MNTTAEDPEPVAVEPGADDAVQPWRQTTFVVWRGKLQSGLCLTARQLPTVSPLVVWRMYEPEGRSAPLVPRRRRMSC